jgi:AhpD family alkylhydroperoxidase
MTREEVYRDIEGKLGMVPSMFKALPEETLELEWGLFKQVELKDDLIPAKYRELIGLAVGSAIGNKFCVLAHRELAQACGASAEEIEVAVRLAKGVAGWGTYLSGTGMSLDTLRGEISQICSFIRSGHAAGGAQTAERAGVSTH